MDATSVFGIVAGVASIIGLCFSIAAWRSAVGAKVAAGQAREAIRITNASEELQELSQLGQELLASAQNAQYEAALLRSRDLLAGIPQASQRWRAFLGDDFHLMEDVAREVGKISRAVSADRAAITPEVRDKLLKSCHRAAEVLAGLVGKMLRRVEGGAHNG
jgi:hypothetical protein